MESSNDAPLFDSVDSVEKYFVDSDQFGLREFDELTGLTNSVTGGKAKRWESH